jgi:hypothetical protein
VPPRWRAPLLVLGLASLVAGLAGGLGRLSPQLAAPGAALAWHGTLMVGSFFGTVIALERAVAVGRAWAYAAPLASGLGGVLLLAGAVSAGLSLLVAAGVLLCAAGIAVLLRQRSMEMATLLAGAGCWLAGNVAVALDADPLAWWMSFFALTIGAERLELSRYLKRPPLAQAAFVAVAAGLVLAPLDRSARVEGIFLALLALWLAAFDLARFTIRQQGLPRFVAACLLPGYFWLAAAGVLLALEGPRPAALHALFLGFAVSMVFGHAPVIAPAILRVAVPYHPVLYLPLALLHLSLALRVAGGLFGAMAPLAAGAWGNAAAIVLFLATVVALVLKKRARRRPS